MDLLFNKDEAGQREIKTLLGFLNADIKYKNLESDIKLNTPGLIHFIGESVYNKIVSYYKAQEKPEIVLHAQLFIILHAYLDFASNGDLIHGNNGRKVQFADNEKTAFEWQIKSDNASLERRSYKALDRLISLLNKEAVSEWLDSEQYQESQKLFISSTATFQKIYPINNSDQLYFRMVPFMAEVEMEHILSILGAQKYEELQELENPAWESDNFKLLQLSKKIIVYRVLIQAWMLLPQEMLGEKVNYKLSENERIGYRKERSREFEKKAEAYEIKMQHLVAKLEATEFNLNPLHGIQSGKKHVNL